MEIQGLIYDLSGKPIVSNGLWTWALSGNEFAIIDKYGSKVNSLSENNCTKIEIQLRDNISTLNAYYNILH